MDAKYEMPTPSTEFRNGISSPSVRNHMDKDGEVQRNDLHSSMAICGVVHLISLILHTPVKELWLKFGNLRCLVECIWYALWEVSGNEFTTTYRDSASGLRSQVGHYCQSP